MAPRNHAACIGNDTVLCGEVVTGRSLLAQFGLTPKSRRGLAAGDVVDGATVPHCGISARPSLRASVTDFARFT